MSTSEAGAGKSAGSSGGFQEDDDDDDDDDCEDGYGDDRRAGGGTATKAAARRQRRRQRGQVLRNKERDLIERMEAEELALNASITQLKDRSHLLQMLGLFSLRKTSPTFLQDYADSQAALGTAQAALADVVRLHRRGAAGAADALRPATQDTLRCLGRLSELRQQVIRSGGAQLELHNAAASSFSDSMLDTVIGQLPMATWMRAFIDLERAWLPPAALVVCGDLLRAWKALEAQVNWALRNAVNALHEEGIRKLTNALGKRVRASGRTFVLNRTGHDGVWGPGEAQPAPAPAHAVATSQTDGALDVVTVTETLAGLDPACGNVTRLALDRVATAPDGGPGPRQSPADRLAALVLCNEVFRTCALRNVQALTAPEVAASFLLTSQALADPVEQLVALLTEQAPGRGVRDSL